MAVRARPAAKRHAGRARTRMTSAKRRYTHRLTYTAHLQSESFINSSVETIITSRHATRTQYTVSQSHADHSPQNHVSDMRTMGALPTNCECASLSLIADAARRCPMALDAYPHLRFFGYASSGALRQGASSGALRQCLSSGRFVRFTSLGALRQGASSECASSSAHRQVRFVEVLCM